MRYSVFLVCVWGFVFGIFARSIWPISFDIEFWIFIISLAFIARRNPKFFLILIFCASTSLGMMRYSCFVSFHGDETLSQEVGKQIIAEGIVVDEPSIKENYTQLTILFQSLESDSPSVSAGSIRVSRFHALSRQTKVIVRDDAYSHIAYGDKVKIEGKLTLPENFQDDSGRTFDYVSYLAKDRIFYQMSFAKVSLVSHGNGNFLKSLIFGFKNKFLKSLDASLPFLESRLAAGLVVAGKQALPKNVQQEFQETGTIQVIVLSGYNVTIVAEAVIATLSFLPLAFGSSISAFFIILFAIAAGGSATIIRAVIMAFIALLGGMLRRNYSVGRALLVAGALMLLQNPMLLVFDPSFQLSFLATVGLIYATPFVMPYVTFFPEKFNLRNTAASTIATQIFVMPFILYLTGALSIVAVPANLLVSLLVPTAMFFGFVSGIIGLIFPLLGIVSGFFAYIFLWAILTIVHIFSIIPYASLNLGSCPVWFVAFIYTVYLFIYFRRNYSQSIPS